MPKIYIPPRVRDRAYLQINLNPILLDFREEAAAPRPRCCTELRDYAQSIRGLGEGDIFAYFGVYPGAPRRILLFYPDVLGAPRVTLVYSDIFSLSPSLFLSAPSSLSLSLSPLTT